MTLSQNISAFRRAKGYTQEQLGELLGVSNQAVSKWETGVSYPDVMLLPSLAEALGVTLNDLYGIADMPPNQIDWVNVFPTLALKQIVDDVCKQGSTIEVCREQVLQTEAVADGVPVTRIKAGRTLGIISYKADGAAFVSSDISVISSEKLTDMGGVFESAEIASGLKKLCAPHVRKVLSYLYAESFKDAVDGVEHLAPWGDLFDLVFSLNEVSVACGLSEEDTLEAIEKLSSVRLVLVSHENNQTRYIFQKTKGVELALLLRAMERYLHEILYWGCGYYLCHGIEPI